MTDIVSSETRSRMMSGIKGKNTRLETFLRSGLHMAGFRFRIHKKDLPGKPDIVFPKYNAIVQANGCFWHGHDCSLFKLPSTNREKWKAKIDGNRKRDQRNRKALDAAGWRVLDVWECAVKGPDHLEQPDVIELVCNWISTGGESAELRGGSERLHKTMPGSHEP